ncbi:MAG: PqqD family protein [Clostridia bacterium]|nr:PqqD family protein [Clostridia bacterium]
MKIKDGYIVSKIGNKYYAISRTDAGENNRMISLNETGAFIWKLLANDTTVEAVADALAAEYEVDKATALADTEAYIKMLTEVGALA